MQDSDASTSAARRRLLIADDHPVFRSGLRYLLHDTFEVVAEARDGYEAIEKVTQFHPHVVTMDIGLPGIDGIEATRRITQTFSDVFVMILSTRNDDQRVLQALEAGAKGYVSKLDDGDSILAGIRAVAEGQAYLPPSVANKVLAGFAESVHNPKSVANMIRPLSEREIEIVRLIAMGYHNGEIGEALCISRRTVGSHLAAIYEKLGVNDRAHLIAYAIKKGLVRLD